MTNIQFLKDRIIIDGHADTKQKCETITLLCDNLAKSKDFKTVRYESGYAEFEKVGATNGLMFAPAQSSVTIIFDSHVTKIDYIVAASSFLPEATGTLTSSGQSIDTTEGVTLNCTLQAGYVIDTVTWSAYEPDYGDSMSHTDTSVSCYSSVAVQGTITITTKQTGSSTPKQTIDLSTLSGWANLSSGQHSITIKAKANGYADSAASNAVSVAKVASGYTVTLNNGDVPVPFSYYINENASVLVGASSLPLVLNNVYKIKLEINATGNYLTNTTGSLVGHENDIFGNYVNITEDSSANVYTDQ